jgi:hypothetical protein
MGCIRRIADSLRRPYFQRSVCRLQGCWRNEMFRQIVGVSTRLACGSQIANMFLRELDETIMTSFRADIALYKRYIDDILMVASKVTLDAVLRVLNSFDEGITVTHDDSEHDKATSFLDLAININRGYVHYSTYRKPMCMYDYLPYNSCHDRSCKLGIFKGECVRLLKTNLKEADFEKQIEFTYRRLLDRGYDRSSLRKIRADFSWHTKKKRMVSRPAPEARKRVMPFKMPYSDCACRLNVGKILMEHSSMLSQSFRDGHRFVLCYTANKNLFRLRYSRFCL